VGSYTYRMGRLMQWLRGTSTLGERLHRHRQGDLDSSNRLGSGRVGDKRVQDHNSGQHWSGTGAHRQRDSIEIWPAPGNRDQEGSFVLIEHRFRQRVPINPTGEAMLIKASLAEQSLQAPRGSPVQATEARGRTSFPYGLPSICMEGR
jgi:hypothetical protein